jgi:hypothetical protein
VYPTIYRFACFPPREGNLEDAVNAAGYKGEDEEEEDEEEEDEEEEDDEEEDEEEQEPDAQEFARGNNEE